MEWCTCILPVSVVIENMISNHGKSRRLSKNSFHQQPRDWTPWPVPWCLQIADKYLSYKSKSMDSQKIFHCYGSVSMSHHSQNCCAKSVPPCSFDFVAPRSRQEPLTHNCYLRLSTSLSIASHLVGFHIDQSWSTEQPNVESD